MKNELKNQAISVNNLLTKYVEFHNEFMKSSSTFRSLFKKVNFQRLTYESYLLFTKFQEEEKMVDLLSKNIGSNEKEFYDCLLRYAKSLTRTVYLLFLMSNALKNKAEGNKLNFTEHMENSNKYKESIVEYVNEGQKLNVLYDKLFNTS